MRKLWVWAFTLAAIAAAVSLSCAPSKGTFEVTNLLISGFAGWAAVPGATPLTGDFNGDGKTDIALTGPRGWATLPVAFSQGDGTFDVTNRPLTGFSTWAAIPDVRPLTGDFDGDGKTDIALTGPSTWVTVPMAFSQGDGTFNVTNQGVAGFAGWAAVPGATPLVGDFNGDGKTDIALTGAAGWATLPVGFSRGDGTFNITNQPAASFAGWAAIPNARPLTGDFNGDGKTDIALTGPSVWITLPVAFSRGDGTFDITNEPVASFAGWATAPKVTPLTGDFNGDGKTDIALTGPSGWAILPVAFSRGDGVFDVANQEAATFANWAATPNATPLTGVFNADGKTDIALTGAAGWASLPLAFSQGDGTFEATNELASSFALWAATRNAKPLAGDFNGDRKTDIALTGASGWGTLPVAFSLPE